MKNFFLFIIFLLVFLFVMNVTCEAQTKNKKPRTIPVTVEHIEKLETGYEVWVKHHNTHYKHGSFHLVKIFEVLPPDLKIGKVLILLPSNDKNEFQVVGKK